LEEGDKIQKMSGVDDAYLSEQIITYIGNKRGLLGDIEGCVADVRERLGGGRLRCADLFAGSGVVSRMLKSHSDKLIVNDIERYSRIINECYLTNRSDFDDAAYEKYRRVVDAAARGFDLRGPISENYAPEDDNDIHEGERVFYTSENARVIDSYRAAIDKVPEDMRKFYLAPLLYEASVHVNTSGVFKGFYKDPETGIGKFGGEGENALRRILGRIELKKPVLSSAECEVDVRSEDANALAEKLADEEGELDMIYLDPPYNQHPYGSNYFMLNVIADNKVPENVSRVSGIPEDWNRSPYNSSRGAREAFEDLIEKAKAKYLIISYNSEGFISFDDMEDILSKRGDVECRKIKYNTFRGSRNLRNRNRYVNEYLFTVKER
jgi:adenine-specific DNA-methyltransferase